MTERVVRRILDPSRRSPILAANSPVVVDLCKDKRVRILSRAIGFAAIFMLTFVVVQIVACDIWQSDECYASTQTPTQGSDRDQPSGDNCLCCSMHATPALAFVFDPQIRLLPAPPVEIVQRPLFAPSSIEHPPHLS